MAEGRRYSFDDAKARRARELEDELSEQRQLIRGGARQQIADIQRVGTEARNGLDHSAAGRTNGIHWGPTEGWEEPDKTVSERSAELGRIQADYAARRRLLEGGRQVEILTRRIAAGILEVIDGQ